MTGTGDQAAEDLTEYILNRARSFIPQKQVREEKNIHRWIDDHCREAAKYKDTVERLLMPLPSEELAAEYHEACEASSAVLGAAFSVYTSKLRAEIQDLPKGSKKW